MTGKKRVKVKLGDVFAIRLDQTRYCYGQVFLREEYQIV